MEILFRGAMKKLIILFVLFICKNGIADCGAPPVNCKTAKSVEVTNIDKSLANIQELLLRKDVVGKDVKCILEISDTKTKIRKKILSHICEFKKNDAHTT